jgi:hypothetical protein
MAEVDQSVVDEILAKASEDTEEGRLEKLEREVETLKGSIKRLLLDIRETMNRLENPFANLQSLAEANIVPQSAPQIQIVPTSIPKGEEGAEEKKEERKEEIKEETPQSRPEKLMEEERVIESTAQPLQPLIKGEAKADSADLFKGAVGKMDFTTLYNLMEWVHAMVSKHSYESFKLMLEVFEMTGYLSDSTKELIMKLADLVKVNGTKDVLVELYLLHKVFNPNDRTMDSDLLSLLLKKR